VFGFFDSGVTFFEIAYVSSDGRPSRSANRRPVFRTRRFSGLLRLLSSYLPSELAPDSSSVLPACADPLRPHALAAAINVPASHSSSPFTFSPRSARMTFATSFILLCIVHRTPLRRFHFPSLLGFTAHVLACYCFGPPDLPPSRGLNSHHSLHYVIDPSPSVWYKCNEGLLTLFLTPSRKMTDLFGAYVLLLQTSAFPRPLSGEGCQVAPLAFDVPYAPARSL